MFKFALKIFITVLFVVGSSMSLFDGNYEMAYLSIIMFMGVVVLWNLEDIKETLKELKTTNNTLGETNE